MKKSKELRKQVEQWQRKAEDDFLVATDLLRAHKRPFVSAVCFHAQQAVEKYIKACLVLHRIVFRKTHDVSELVALLPSQYAPDLAKEEQEQLSEYAVIARYPGEEERITFDDAEEAVGIAQKARAYFRRRLAEEDD